MADSEFLIRAKLDTSGIREGVQQIEQILTGAAGEIATSLDSIFAAGAKPSAIGSELLSGGQATQPVVGALGQVGAVAQQAGFSEAELTRLIKPLLGQMGFSAPQIQSSQAQTVAARTLAQLALQQADVGRAALEADQARASASRTVAQQQERLIATQRQQAAEAELVTQLYREQRQKGLSIVDAQTRAQAIADKLVEAQNATGASQERILEGTIDLAQQTAQRVALGREAAAAVSTGLTAQGRFNLAVEELAANVAEMAAEAKLSGKRFIPGQVGKSLDDLTTSYGAVLEEEQAAHRDGIAAQGRLNSAIKAALAETELSVEAQGAAAASITRIGEASAPQYAAAIQKAIAFVAGNTPEGEGGRRARETGNISFEQAYNTVQEKRLAESQEAAAVEAAMTDEDRIILARRQLIAEQETRRQALLEQAIAAQRGQAISFGEGGQRIVGVSAAQARYDETQQTMNSVLANEVASEEEKLIAVRENTAAAKQLTESKVAAARALKAYDDFEVDLSGTYVQLLQQKIADQRRIVELSAAQYREAGVAISQAQLGSSGEASDAQLQIRANALARLDADKADLEALERRYAEARSYEASIAAEKERELVTRSGILQATGGELSQAERRAVIATEFNAALQAEYEKQLVTLQAQFGTKNLAAIRTQFDPIAAEGAVNRAQAAVLERQQAALASQGGDPEAIATAQANLQKAYARLSRALLDQIAIHERNNESLLREPVTRVASLQREIEAALKGNLASYDELTVAQQRIVENLRKSAAETGIQYNQTKALVENGTYETLTAEQQKVVDNVRRSAALAEKTAALYDRFYGEEEVALASPGRFAFLRPPTEQERVAPILPGAQPGRTSDAEEVAISQRAAADKLLAEEAEKQGVIVSNETTRIQQDIEFAKRRSGLESERLTTAEAALRGEQAEVEANEQLVAKKRSRQVVESNVGENPQAGLAAQGDAAARLQAAVDNAEIGVQATAVAAQEAAAAFHAAAGAAALGGGADEIAALRSSAQEVARVNQELVARNATLLKSQEELETQLRAQKASSEQASATAKTLAEAQADNATAQVALGAVAGLDATSLSVEAAAAIAETGYTEQAIRRVGSAGKRLEEATLADVEALTIAAAETRKRVTLEAFAAQERLGVTGPLFAKDSTTAERVQITEQLKDQLKAELEETRAALAAARRIAEANLRAADATEARTQIEVQAQGEALIAVQANEDKVLTQTAINEALLAQLQSAEIISVEGKTYSELLGESIINQKLINAEKQRSEAAALTPAAATGIVAGETAKAQEAALLSEERASTVALIEANVEVTAQKKIQAAREQTLLLSNDEYIRVQAELTVAQQRYKAALDEQVVALGGAGRGGGQGGGGGPRGFLGGFKGRFGFNDNNPEGDVAGSFGSSLAQQARFFLPFAAAFGAYSQIKAAVKDAEELERVLAVTKLQFDDLNKGDQFSAFRTGIIDISKRTGEAAADVALVAQQLQAAFGGDTARALRETDSAMEAIRISGLSGQQVVNDFTAIIKSFGESSTSVRQLTDSAVGLQERFGVLVKDTIEFSGAIAPIAAETGFTAKQIEALGAAYQEFSGRAGATGAENLGRILSGIQDKSVKLVEFLQSNLPDVASQVASSLSSGNIEQVFEELLTNYGRLNQQQQESLLATIGGRRETAALAAIFKDSSKVLDELQGRTDDAGKSQQAFANTEQSLAQQVAELGKQFKAFGIALYDSGIGDGLKAVVGYLQSIVQFGQGVANFFQTLNDLSHGLVGSLVTVAVQLGLIYESMKLIASLRAVQGIAGLLGGAGAEGGLLARVAGGLRGTAAVGAETAAPVEIAASSFTGGVGGTLTASAAAAGGGGLLAGLTSVAGGSAYYAPYVAIGGLIAKTVIETLHSGMTKNINSGIKTELGVPQARTQDDVQKLLGDINLQVPGSGQDEGNIDFTKDQEKARGARQRLSQYANQRITTAQQLGEILAADKDAYKTIYDAIGGSASTVQKSLDLVGLSQNTDSERERAKQAVTAVNNQAAAKLEQVINTPDRVKKLLDELRASGTYDTLFGGPDAKPGTSYDSATSQLNALLQHASDTGGDPNALGGVDTQKLNILGKALSGFSERASSAEQAALKQAQIADEQNQLLAQDATALKSQFDAGLVGLGAYLSGLDSLQVALDKLAADGTPLAVDAALKNQKAKIAAASSALLQSVTIFNDIATATGNDNPADQVSRLTDLLKNPTLNTADRLTATKQLIAAIKAEKQYEASLVTDAAEKARILSEATPLPEGAQEVLIQEYLSADTAFQKFLDTTLTGQGEIQTAITQLVANQLANGVKSINQAVINSDKLELVILYKQLAYLQEIAGVDRGSDGIQDKINSIAQQINDVTAEYIAAINNQVPDVTIPDVSSTKGSAGDRAQADKQAADQARQDAKRLRDANRSFYLALAGGDPVKQAQAAQQAADAALSDAQNDPSLNAIQRQAAILEAQAQRVQADNQFASAIKDIAKAQSNLVIAMLNASGDTVGAAKEAAAEAQREYQQALNETASGRGPGDAALKNLQAASVNAAAQAHSQELQDKIQHEQFLKDVGKVTTAQFIGFLQSLLSDPTLIKKEREDIQRQIYQLQHTLSQDFKFNLPSVLGLPTLYEARRLGQLGGSAGPGGGAGYQDNRVITINFANPSNANPRDIANAVSNAIGPPSRFSTYSNKY